MRFAYLILAHNNFEQLKMLIKAIDFKDNDIFVHFDIKLGHVDLSQFDNITKYASVTFLDDRIDVAWGRVSIVEATLNLLEKASKGNYDYYHMLSGVDFPIKKNSYIYGFFEKNSGKEFVGFSPIFNENTFKARLSRYHLINGNKYRRSSFWRRTNSVLILLQKVFHIYHYKSVDKFRGGPAWFSITNGLAMELVKNKSKILKDYKYVLLPDEIFLQTFIWNSKYKDNLFKNKDDYVACMRKIDWERGNPYIWKVDDYNELIEAPHIFARKIDYNLAAKLLSELSE